MAKKIGIALAVIVVIAAAFLGVSAIRPSAPTVTGTIPTFVSQDTERIFGMNTSQMVLSEKLHFIIATMPAITAETGPIRRHTRLEVRVHDYAEGEAPNLPAHKRYIGEWIVEGDKKSANVVFAFIETSAGFEFAEMKMLGRSYKITELQ